MKNIKLFENFKCVTNEDKKYQADIQKIITHIDDIAKDHSSKDKGQDPDITISIDGMEVRIPFNADSYEKLRSLLIDAEWIW